MAFSETGRLPRPSRLFVGAAVLALTVVGAGATGQPPIPPGDVPAGRAPGAIEVAQSDAVVAQQSMRIDRLEDQMRQLNGRIDEMTYSLQRIQDLLKRMQEDNEYRFQQLEGGGRRPQKRSEAPAAPDGTDMASAGDAMITTGAPDVPADLAAGFSIDPQGDPQGGDTADTGGGGYGAGPQVLGTMPADAPVGGGGPLDLSAIARGDFSDQPLPPGTLPGVSAGIPPAVANPAPGLPQPVASQPLPAPPGSDAAAAAPVRQNTQIASLGTPPDPRDAYDQAYGYVVAGDYGAAEQALKQFLADHPRDKLAGDAHFWLGETYYARGAYRDAAESFLATYRDYPKSRKAPESLLKLGLSLQSLGETDAACATYREVEKKFPNASGAVLAKVASQKSRAGC